METFVKVTRSSKSEVYDEILPQIESLLAGETDLIANLGNTCSVLKVAFPETISWVGFYVMKSGELVLGPFQGKPACVRIKVGKGVCGTAAEHGKTLIVPDVLDFPGHIFCDPDSKSEIVVPIKSGSQVVAVLDLDSGKLASFDEMDKLYLERIADMVSPFFSSTLE